MSDTLQFVARLSDSLLPSDHDKLSASDIWPKESQMANCGGRRRRRFVSIKAISYYQIIRTWVQAYGQSLRKNYRHQSS
jgi:hypothetical protein